MQRVAAGIRGAINPQSFGIVTLVPILPSKPRTDPEHDPRMIEIARMVSPQADVRELIEPVAARLPQHESEQRLQPGQLAATLQISPLHCNPRPQNILLIDDVITTGCSFVACSAMLQQQFPGVPIPGIFAARRALDHSDDFKPLINP